MTYLSLIDHDAQHTPALCDFNVPDMDFSSPTPANCLVEAVVEFRKGRIALVTVERVNIGVQVGIKTPMARSVISMWS